MRGLFTAVPPDYDRTALALMHDGYRVIALGCKSLPRAVRPAALKAMRPTARPLFDTHRGTPSLYAGGMHLPRWGWRPAL